jgi:hypothetical protein
MFVNETSLSQCNDLQTCRTVSDVVQSCFATIFICTWVSIHPNVPAPGESWGTMLVRRLFIMTIAILAPELVVAWSVREMLIAFKVANRKESKGMVFILSGSSWMTEHFPN